MYDKEQKPVYIPKTLDFSKRSFIQTQLLSVTPPLPEEQAPVSQQSLSYPTDLEVNLTQMPYPC